MHTKWLFFIYLMRENSLFSSSRQRLLCLEQLDGSILHLWELLASADLRISLLKSPVAALFYQCKVKCKQCKNRNKGCFRSYRSFFARSIVINSLKLIEQFFSETTFITFSNLSHQINSAALWSSSDQGSSSWRVTFTKFVFKSKIRKRMLLKAV